MTSDVARLADRAERVRDAGCSRACRVATTCSPRSSPSARTDAGTTRWSPTSAPRHRAGSSTSPAGRAAVTCALAARDGRGDRRASTSAERDARRGRGATSRARASTERVGLVLGRGEQLPFADGAFDALTFTYLLRYVADPAATIAELARVVRPGGAIASLEFAVPPSPFWRACVVGLHAARPARRRARDRGRAWYDVGRFLGPSISRALRGLSGAVDPRRLAARGHRARRAPPHEPRRRARHVGHAVVTRSDAGRRPTARAAAGPAFYTDAEAAAATVAPGLVDAAAPALHRVAPRLRRDRRVPPRTGERLAPPRDAARVLPRRRRRRRTPSTSCTGARCAPSSPTGSLVAAAVLGLGGAAVLGIIGIATVGPWLGAFVAVGVVLALGYNLELFGGALHSDAVFAVSLGCVPRPHRVLRPARHAQRRSGLRGGLRVPERHRPAAALHARPRAPASHRRRSRAGCDGVDGSTTRARRRVDPAPLEGALRVAQLGDGRRRGRARARAARRLTAPAHRDPTRRTRVPHRVGSRCVAPRPSSTPALRSATSSAELS